MQQVGRSMLWGQSIAMSWTWGLGLFFSVQISLLFGLPGLLAFVIPNALGLVIFGVLTHRIATRDGEARVFEKHFFSTSHSLWPILLAYQLTAVALTFFAAFRYLFQPLGIDLPLAVLLVFGAALLLGEQFPISMIKWTHLVAFGLVVPSALLTMGGLLGWMEGRALAPELFAGVQSWGSWGFAGYVVPMLAGLLIGPWLDIQQWQRAIQIHRENAHVQRSYLFGAALFFSIIVFHGVLALLVASAAIRTGGFQLSSPSLDGLFHAKQSLVRFIFDGNNGFPWWMKAGYFTFLLLCLITTLDSGYVALKWYMKELVRKSDHVLLGLLPQDFLGSAALPMTGALIAAVAGVLFGAELEYFMSFYASFSVGYAIVFLFRTTYKPEFTQFTHTTLFSVGAFGLGLFGVGYFKEYPVCMMLGALLPLAHGFLTISGRVVVDDLQKALPRPDSSDRVPTESVTGKAAQQAVHALESAISRLDPKVAERFQSVLHRVEPQAAAALATVLQAIQPLAEGPRPEGAPSAPSASAVAEHARGHFEGKWFTYTFLTTYQDTNSVGNVYFGMYPMFVGKVREMFFRTVMPNFDLRTTPYYILTRSIEHKFHLESREFEMITVKIRVESFNRKFATLEHMIYNEAQQVLGKGRQVLLFVSREDYRIVDMPNEVKMSFLPHC